MTRSGAGPCDCEPARAAIAAELVHHRHVAARLGLRVEQFRRYVRAGLWPLPFSEVGSLWLYRVEDVDHYVRSGRWPEGVKYARR